MIVLKDTPGREGRRSMFVQSSKDAPLHKEEAPAPTASDPPAASAAGKPEAPKEPAKPAEAPVEAATTTATDGAKTTGGGASTGEATSPSVASVHSGSLLDP